MSLVPDETVETLVRHFADHLHSWGGAPLMSVFDRPKTVALKWQRDGVVTEWNPTFAYAALEIGVGVDVRWPYRPREKGSVENLVGFVKGSFFKQRRFHDEVARPLPEPRPHRGQSLRCHPREKIRTRRGLHASGPPCRACRRGLRQAGARHEGPRSTAFSRRGASRPPVPRDASSNRRGTLKAPRPRSRSAPRR